MFACPVSDKQKSTLNKFQLLILKTTTINWIMHRDTNVLQIFLKLKVIHILDYKRALLK